jgi:hypothetical protein
MKYIDKECKRRERTFLFYFIKPHLMECTRTSNTQVVAGGKFSIMESHSIGNFKQNVHVCKFPISTFSEVELFHCTVIKL